MKRMLFRTIMVSFLAIISTSINAQTEWPNLEFTNECLGKHCEISVNLNSDPVVSGYLKYTIQTPRESIDFISGPASCFLMNHLGSTVEIHVRRSQLELALSDQPYAQVPFELFVKLWKRGDGHVRTDPAPGYQQCFYYVVFNMNILN